jgi:hypothetical protein
MLYIDYRHEHKERNKMTEFSHSSPNDEQSPPDPQIIEAVGINAEELSQYGIELRNKDLQQNGPMVIDVQNAIPLRRDGDGNSELIAVIEAGGLPIEVRRSPHPVPTTPGEYADMLYLYRARGREKGYAAGAITQGYARSAEDAMIIGRGSNHPFRGRLGISYDETPGVSRDHLRIRGIGPNLYEIKDDSSKYGTRVITGAISGVDPAALTVEGHY